MLSCRLDEAMTRTGLGAGRRSSPLVVAYLAGDKLQRSDTMLGWFSAAETNACSDSTLDWLTWREREYSTIHLHVYMCMYMYMYYICTCIE